MALQPGTRIGSYEITGQIGAGGMGEVYRATDAKLGRQVAIKVLPAALAHDPERLARFDREARTLATLNHPNIAAIHGLEDVDGFKALVMELVEGPTLADRLAQEAIPWDETMPIALQIADALAVAHEQGIVHRDLKPANVKLRPDGVVKVLDFGLAKGLDPTDGGLRQTGTLSMSPTITSPAMTQAGMILGTAAYMSPEQARGRAVDKRADIWAFGCVLFEMLTGQRAFDGEELVDVLGAVTRLDPNWAALPQDLPLPVVTLIQSCLVKDPRHRVREITTAAFILKNSDSLASKTASSTGGSAIVDARTATASTWRRRTAAVGVGALLLGAAGTALWTGRAQTTQHVTRAAIPLTGALRLSGEGVALSPDGLTLALPAGNHLVLRRLDRDEFIELPGTEGATLPFFSPDGLWVGFVVMNGSGDVLRRVRTDGSTIQTITPNLSIVNGRPHWAADDTIVYGLIGDGLFSVSASGGTPRRLTEPRRDMGEVGHGSPQLLPDGRTLLFTIDRSSTATAAVLAPDTKQWRTLPAVNGYSAKYVASGHLAFVEQATLFVVGFNPVEGAVIGTAVPFANSVGASFDVSVDGTLAFRSSAADQSTLTVRGRIMLSNGAGAMSKVAPDELVTLEAGGGLAFAPDGERFMASMRHPDPTSTAQLWLYDLRKPGVRLRVTNQGSLNAWPTWSPDGSQVAYVSIRDQQGIYVQPPVSDAPAKMVVPRGNVIQFPQAWTHTGAILFAEIGGKGRSDIFVLEPNGSTAPLVATSAVEFRARISPDGRWLAYQSDTSGQPQIYLRLYAGSGSGEIVSSGGGTEPRWTSDGLIYRRGTQVVSVPTTFTGDTARPGKETVLFRVDDHATHYDVSPDGTKFLFLGRPSKEDADPTLDRVHVVLNWNEELERLILR